MCASKNFLKLIILSFSLFYNTELRFVFIHRFKMCSNKNPNPTPSRGQKTNPFYNTECHPLIAIKIMNQNKTTQLPIHIQNTRLWQSKQCKTEKSKTNDKCHRKVQHKSPTHNRKINRTKTTHSKQFSQFKCTHCQSNQSIHKRTQLKAIQEHTPFISKSEKTYFTSL